MEFERFLSGAAQLAPEEQRLRLVSELRELRNANLRSAVDNFRLGSLEARFNSYCELYQRRLRDREEGRSARNAKPLEPTAPRYDAERGVVLTSRLEAAAVEALFAALAQQATGRPPLELDAFRGYLARQVEEIQQKSGCSAVRFRLAIEEGKVKLKAKPVAG